MTSSDLLRDAADNQLKHGKVNEKQDGEYIKECIKRGMLVPDEIVLPIITSYLKKSKSGSFIFDGFPR